MSWPLSLCPEPGVECSLQNHTLDLRVRGLHPCAVCRIQLVWGLATSEEFKTRLMPMRDIAGLIQAADLRPELEDGLP